MIDTLSRRQRITILPVYPKFPTTFWSFKHAVEFVGKRAIMPPTGLATVAAMLPDEHFEVLPVMDLNVCEFDEDAMAAADNPDELKLELRGITKGAAANGDFDFNY